MSFYVCLWYSVMMSYVRMVLTVNSMNAVPMYSVSVSGMSELVYYLVVVCLCLFTVCVRTVRNVSVRL